MRRVVGTVAAALALIALGCSGDAERAGRDAATAGASGITFFVRNSVVQPGATPTAQLARVQRWLADPPPADLEQIGHPAYRVLPSTGAMRVDVAVWAFGQTTAIEGKDGAWGHVCVRYTVDPAGRLGAVDVDCPEGLPDRPD